MQRVLIILACILTATVAMAQESQENRFVRITHTADRTIAVDSAGDEWIYDSSQGEFVNEEDYEGTTRHQSSRDDSRDYGPDEMILPPEIRCTEIIDGDITDIFNEVVVELDERVEGSVTSGRNVIVKGLVIGNVVSYRTVTIEGTGEVRGDVIAREIIRDRGGRILGQRKEVPFPETLGIGVPRVTGILPDFMGIIFTAFLIFLCIITIALFPKHLGRIVAKIRESEIKAFVYGTLTWFAILPLFVLLVITIVGIPVALLIFPFVLLAAIILGYVAITVYIGTWLAPRFGWQEKSIYIKSIIGVIFIAAARLLANFFSFIGATGLDTFLGIVYMILAAVAINIGLGAVVSSKFGIRPKPTDAAPGAEPPPSEPPPVPPVKPPPPPKSDPVPPQIIAPPPPVPPPSPKSGNATDEG